MVLPHQVTHAQHTRIRVEHLVERGVAIFPERDVIGLVLGQVGNPQRVELRDQRLHLRAPLAVQLRPVLKVVAGTLLEELGALGHLGRIGDRIARDVDVAIDHPPVDAHRRRHREHPVLPFTDRLVGRVDADHVERRHRLGEVHRVPEPEPILVPITAALVKQAVIRVHRLPTLASRAASRSRTDSETSHRRHSSRPSVPPMRGSVRSV